MPKPPRDMHTGKPYNNGLGGEPNRQGAESAAMADAKAALGGLRKLENIIVFNTVDAEKWDIVDSGNAPTPERARYPGVISVIALQRARAKVGKDFK